MTARTLPLLDGVLVGDMCVIVVSVGVEMMGGIELVI